jgi:hypothetical protein
MRKKKKLYINKGYNKQEHIAFPDGSAIIHCKNGIIIIEGQTPYGMNNLFYKFDDFNIALN